MKLIFTVSLNESEGLNINGQPTVCEMANISLKRRIATHSINNDDLLNIEDSTYEDNYDFTINTGFETETISNSTMFQQIVRIYENCVADSNNEQNSSGDHDNLQHNPEIAKKLLAFCKLILAGQLLWFQYSITETWLKQVQLLKVFNDLKTNIFKYKTLPLRIDEFIVIHLNSI